MNNAFLRYSRHFILLILTVSFVSCVNQYLPETKDAFDPEAGFSQYLYTPKLGKNTLMTGNFNPGSSTLPFTYEIVNLRRYDGSEAPEFSDKFPVKVWKTPYLGTETSLEAIEAKRDIEYRQLFQIRKHTGEFILWENAKAAFVRCDPDPGYVFDIKVENSGGLKYYKDFRLVPEREASYEPSNIDPKTGLAAIEYVNPTSTSMLVTRKDQRFYVLSAEDIHVYFHKNLEMPDTVSTITFRFLNADYTPINPDKFNTTKWEKLVHGFDLVKDTVNKFVRYKVAYPIPLVETPTSYTNKTGERAHVSFSYNWIYYGYRMDSEMTFDFAIYEKGNWEISIVFAEGNPYFGEGN
ncbi:DUF5007 domain-containing protein [Sunxiuqinia indica]|uniref:DUF5007 domain-containing protein n=1 Tax=Sunxiuqinia indica TaxID=2692584 RepID=UPI00135ADB27|nr:DUF5007 domain-containing protein [Sunxiuqinia indica]